MSKQNFMMKHLMNDEHEQVSQLSLEDDCYPYLLRETATPPKELFYRGSLDLLNVTNLIAVVGTRQITDYGVAALQHLIPPLVQSGAAIVSGLAYGVDALAHQITLECGGKGIAVLGSGADQIFPRCNLPLAKRLLKNGGTILSEHPNGTLPRKQYFPARNRIISGLSKATIVIEAGKKSGALITARFALDQNREVYAVPGSIFSSQSLGTNAIISQGAHPITSAEELLIQLDLLDRHHKPRKAAQLSFENEQESQIYEQLQEPRSIDQLAQTTQMESSVISQALTMLELRGMIKSLEGLRYIRV